MGMIQDIRTKHPEYNDLSDQALADALHAKFYADMPKDQFLAKIGAGQQQQPPEDLPSTFSQHTGDLALPGAAASLFGASDAQLADIMQKQLGDKFVRRETAHVGGNNVQTGGPRSATGYKAPEDYQVMVTRGPDGQEQRSYVNKPGLDWEDVGRAAVGSLPFMATGGAAGAATAGRGLVAQSLALGGAGAATSAAGDVAQMPLGSEQGIEVPKALAYGAFGAAAPIASRAVGNLAGAVAERNAPLTGPLQGASRKAVSRVEEAMAADGRMSPNAYQAKAWALGDEGMLGDMGRTLQGDTAVLARTPISKDIAANAIGFRQQGAPDRIKDGITAALGRERDLPSYIEQQAKAHNAWAKPYYDLFKDARIQPSEKLYSILDAAKASGAYDKALKKLQIKQLDPNAPKNTGLFLDLIKRELDGMAGAAKTAGNRTEYADFADLAKQLRTEVDSILSPQNPANSVWARGRAIAGEGLEGREAVEAGSKVFSGKADPNLVRADLGGMSAFGKEMYREGARNDLRQVMGRASSNFGPKGDTAARRALNNDFSKANVSTIAGPVKAARLEKRINAENAMAELHDMALGNSITDTMQASRKRLGLNAEPGDFASRAGQKGPMGHAYEISLKVLDAMVGHKIKKSQNKMATDMARILTATGPQRDRIVEALFKHVEARKTGKITGAKFERLTRALLEAGRVPAVTEAQSYSNR